MSRKPVFASRIVLAIRQMGYSIRESRDAPGLWDLEYPGARHELVTTSTLELIATMLGLLGHGQKIH